MVCSWVTWAGGLKGTFPVEVLRPSSQDPVCPLFVPSQRQTPPSHVTQPSCSVLRVWAAKKTRPAHLPKRTYAQGLVPLLPLLWLFYWTHLWRQTTPSLYTDFPMTFWVLVGVLFSNVTCHLIISTMSSQTLDIFNPMLLPLPLAVFCSQSPPPSCRFHPVLFTDVSNPIEWLLRKGNSLTRQRPFQSIPTAWSGLVAAQPALFLYCGVAIVGHVTFGVLVVTGKRARQHCHDLTLPHRYLTSAPRFRTGPLSKTFASTTASNASRYRTSSLGPEGKRSAARITPGTRGDAPRIGPVLSPLTYMQPPGAARFLGYLFALPLFLPLPLLLPRLFEEEPVFDFELVVVCFIESGNQSSSVSEATASAVASGGPATNAKTSPYNSRLSVGYDWGTNKCRLSLSPRHQPRHSVSNVATVRPFSGATSSLIPTLTGQGDPSSRLSQMCAKRPTSM